MCVRPRQAFIGDSASVSNDLKHLVDHINEQIPSSYKQNRMVQIEL